MVVFVLLGPPGAGKGTQISKYIAENKNLDIVSVNMGFLLRSIISGDSLNYKTDALPKQMLKEIRDIVASGHLVSDDIVCRLFADYFDSLYKPGTLFFLDGFPRNIEQAIYLESYLHDRSISMGAVLEFSVDLNVLYRRISGRYSCSSCGASYNVFFDIGTAKMLSCTSCNQSVFTIRPDDSRETLENRFKVYESSVGKLRDFYKKNGYLKKIEASWDFPLVYKEFSSFVKEKYYGEC